MKNDNNTDNTITLESFVNYNKEINKMKKCGQGIIEYAGALIVAAFVVASIMVVGTEGFGNMYSAIYNNVSQMLIDGIN